MGENLIGFIFGMTKEQDPERYELEREELERYATINDEKLLDAREFSIDEVKRVIKECHYDGILFNCLPTSYLKEIELLAREHHPHTSKAEITSSIKAIYLVVREKSKV